MEKRTMGSFIAALRRAEGMTQRELAERLNVSDKTISRWECDDGYPDLTLIPVIAEIFGVTADELLRGQRSTTKKNVEEAPQESTSKKGTKELKMLRNLAVASFRSRSIFAIGTAVLGVFVTAVFNIGFNRGLIGFFLGCLFMVAGIVLEIVSINSALTKDYDDVDDGKIRNTIIRFSELTFSIIAILFMFILPIAMLLNDTFVGLTAGSWMEYGLPMALAALVVCLIVILFLNGHFVRKGILVLSEEEKTRYLKIYKLRTRSGAVLAAILLVTFIVQNVLTNTTLTSDLVEGTTFNDLDSFVAYMEQDVPAPWNIEDHAMNYPDTTYYDQYGNEIPREQFLTETITDVNGNELVTFVHLNEEVASYSFNSKGGSILPITTFTYDDLNRAELERQRRNNIFVFIYVLELIVFAFVYYILKKRID